MMVYKGCERCSGDLFIEEEGRFKDLVCLQCGFRPSNGGALIDAMRVRAAHRPLPPRQHRHHRSVTRT